ncbi:MAG: methyltransferase domain-containing protein [Halobacteriovoraceae bacterium]|nr:methyltransferase domain-containing protein [Halobacteriovoraceae bacterium]
MAKCLVCGSEYESFINFGKQPVANRFIPPGEYESEYFFEMKVGFCEHCKMVQLENQPEREEMFNETYAFYSSTSEYMKKHFQKFAESIKNKYCTTENPFVVEMGSNDGIMMQNFKNWNMRHLGVEPSKNVAEVARSKGINTINEFFSEELAQKIIAEYGQADAFLSANVMCHIPYIHSIGAGIAMLLKPKGVLCFEDPYICEVIDKTSYDQIYDEHVFLFSVMSVSAAFERHGLEVIDCEYQITHGGSMRYTLGHKGQHQISENVKKQLEYEKKMGIDKLETYQQFAKNVENSKNQLLELLTSLKKEGKRVVGYGATSKSTTVLNYCGIGPEFIDFISDTTPIKQGKVTPGTHIPVRPYEEFSNDMPEYALLFAWNHKDEIMAKEDDFKTQKGKWITYIPEVHIFE